MLDIRLALREIPPDLPKDTEILTPKVIEIPGRKRPYYDRFAKRTARR
jgi:hypothetical protein